MGLCRSRIAFLFLWLLLSFVSARIVCAQTYIFGRADFPTGNEPRGVAVGDLNGDGIPDLVVANSTDNTISVLLGKADGTFSPKVDYPAGVRPVSVAIADLNNDGNPDLVVANENCTVITGMLNILSCGPGTVSVFLGNGDGTFQGKIDYATGEEPLCVVTGDFNSDGKIDLATANANDNTVSILLGNGDGTFQPQSVLSIANGGPDSVRFIVAADFNADSKLDLVVVNLGTISIFLGNGDGTFRAGPQSTILVPLGNYGFSAVAGDFNQDGKLDFAVSSTLFGAAGTGNLSIFLGQGDGSFVFDGNYPGNGQVIAADFNGDGKLDLASDLGLDSISVLLGNGDGTFKPPAEYAAGSNPAGLVVADFNGDGKLDLAVANSGCAPVVAQSSNNCTSPSTSVSVLLGIGNGAFVGQTNFPVSAGPEGLTTGDFNLDGKTDLATTSAILGNQDVSVLLGNGDGTFASATSFATGSFPDAIATGDFRGMGRSDLAVVDQLCQGGNCGPGAVSILLSNGDGTFQPHVDYSVRVDPRALVIGDFNGDGKSDVAVVNYQSNTVSILLSNGDGTFRSAVDYATAPFPIAIVVGDFNGDGKLDLAVVGVGTGVSILLGNGDGTFRPHVDFPAGSDPRAIAVADFNRDGKADLAVATTASSSGPAVVAIFLGNGDGTFGPEADYPSSGVMVGNNMLVADFNGDGKPDLAMAAGAGVSLQFGNGDGTFQMALAYLAGAFADSVAVGDFNKDGVPDLAAADGINNVVAVLSSVAFKAVYPTGLIFTSQGLGTTSSARTITVSNPSNVSFTFSGATATGDFAATNNCATLAPGTQCSINVQFTPSAVGARTGMLTLTDTTKSSPEVISLSGSGVNGAFLSLSAAKLNFDPLAIGSLSPSQAVTISNTGNSALSITSITITGSNAGDFADSSSCPASLNAGQSCTVSATFSPIAAGTRIAALTIANSGPSSPLLVTLEGTGLGPQNTLSVASLSFPSQHAGTTSSPQAVNLTNSGNTSLAISQISVSANFSQTNNCGSSLAPATSCQIQVSFAPNMAGNLTGSLTISDNAANSPATVALSGVAVSLNLGVPSGGSNSATIAAGGTASYTLTIGGGGIAGTASLSCSGAPQAAMCNIPTSLSVSATSPSTFPVSVTTGTRSFGARPHTKWPPPPVWPLIVASVIVLVLTAWFRRLRFRLGYIAAAIILAAFLTSCGGGGSSGGTPAGTYTLTVTATSASTSDSTSLTLVVQ